MSAEQESVIPGPHVQDPDKQSLSNQTPGHQGPDNQPPNIAKKITIFTDLLWAEVRSLMDSEYDLNCAAKSATAEVEAAREAVKDRPRSRDPQVQAIIVNARVVVWKLSNLADAAKESKTSVEYLMEQAEVWRACMEQGEAAEAAWAARNYETILRETQKTRTLHREIKNWLKGLFPNVVAMREALDRERRQNMLYKMNRVLD